jgi:hypothetical protein
MCEPAKTERQHRPGRRFGNLGRRNRFPMTDGTATLSKERASPSGYAGENYGTKPADCLGLGSRYSRKRPSPFLGPIFGAAHAMEGWAGKTHIRKRPPQPASLQAGTGTVQSTAISTAIRTPVIFSLVDRSMASSERDANLSAALYAASRAFAVTVITLRPVCFSGLSPRPLVGFGGRRGLRGRGRIRRRRGGEPRHRGLFYRCRLGQSSPMRRCHKRCTAPGLLPGPGHNVATTWPGVAAPGPFLFNRTATEIKCKVRA